jgi:hypothetical protein
MNDEESSRVEGGSDSNGDMPPKMGKGELVYLLAMGGLWLSVTGSIILDAKEPLVFVALFVGSLFVGFMLSFGLEIARSWHDWKGSLRRFDGWFGVLFASLGIATIALLLIGRIPGSLAVALTSVWAGFFLYQYVPLPSQLQSALARLAQRLFRPR